jgi:hypothetical protein
MTSANPGESAGAQTGVPNDPQNGLQNGVVVRRLRSGEAVLLRALRLEALGDAQQDFDTSTALTATWSPADWRPAGGLPGRAVGARRIAGPGRR